MPAVTVKGIQRSCYVIMGFGKKTDFESGRTLDLDKTYRNIIKPAAEAAGLECVRADEIIHSGLIDQPMFNLLLQADVVIADLSTANTHALYELGVRHALRPSTTIIVAEDKFWAVPFDVVQVPVRRYKHLGEDIGFDEATRFRKELTTAITEALENDPPPIDSPVYTFLPQLSPPTLNAKPLADLKPLVASEDTPQLSSSTEGLLGLANEAKRTGDFLTAKRLLTYVHETKPSQQRDLHEEAYLVQQLAFVTYKSKHPNEMEALEEARTLLSALAPAYSADTETLGLWGAVHKRLWDLTQDTKHLDEAVDSYERGFYLRRDYYSGINLAFLLNVRVAHQASRAEAIADFVQAVRIRRQVLAICEQLLKAGQLNDDNRYWAQAAMAEAYLGVGEEKKSQETLQQAFAAAPSSWMKASTEEQLAKLRHFLAESPLGSL